MATKSVFMKFRTTEEQRDRLIKTATRAGTTSSALLRRFIVNLPQSALPNAVEERAGWITVRQLANQILTASSEASQAAPESTALMRVAAGALHRLASQRLGPMP